MASNNPVKLFELKQTMRMDTDILGFEFRDEFLQITKDGVVKLFYGLCSDGCSPTYVFPFIGVVGPWNGPKPYPSALPVTARAFFLHDALLERRKEIGIPVEQIHRAFSKEIGLTDFVLKDFYSFLARHFGPRD